MGEKITEIDVPFPGTDDLHLRLTVGACRLRIGPGEGESWVTGTYRDPSGNIPLKIALEGGTARISPGESPVDALGLIHGFLGFDLALGKARSYMLTIESGASENLIDLGGLPIARLQFKQGAGKAEIDFSSPNLTEMSMITMGVGACSLEVNNLANADFAEMIVDGGASAYKFDFGGARRRNSFARISTGMSSVDLRFPVGAAAKITTEQVVGGFDIGDGFTKKEGAFWTEAAVKGETPILTVHAGVAIGSLRISQY